MAQWVDRRWYKIGKLIELAVAMGCELRELPGKFTTPDGSYQIRYLYSPHTDDFVSLSDLGDDESVPPSELASWERRLGITFPGEPASHH